jgi:hypothetical protein
MPQIGAEHAIVNYRKVMEELSEARILAEALPDCALVRDVEAALIRVSDSACQADVPAEWELEQGNSEGALRCIEDAMLRVYETAGIALQQLEAALLVSAERGLPGVTAAAQPQSKTAPFVPADIDLQILKAMQIPKQAFGGRRPSLVAEIAEATGVDRRIVGERLQLMCGLSEPLVRRPTERNRGYVLTDAGAHFVPI